MQSEIAGEHSQLSGSEIAFLTIEELASAYRSRQLSPVEVVQSQLDRIARWNSMLHSYLLVQEEEALAAARKAEREISRGRSRGPLHGVPVAHKDIYWTKDIRTTAHSRVLADFVPHADATVVTRWQAAGGISLGKLNTHEFACGGMDLWGFAVNPHDPKRVAGNSSSGPASAVAAGLCYGATGSDTLASIRAPASFCGVVGIKPTYGRVSRYGVIPVSWTLDHCGPIARTVADCTLLLQAMAGHDPKDPTTGRKRVPDYKSALTRNLKGLRIGVPEGWFFEEMHPETEAAIRTALLVLRELGATVMGVEIKYLPEVTAASGVICWAEAYSIHEKWLAERGESYGAHARRVILQGGLYSAAEYLRSMRVRELFIRELEALYQRVDAILVPATTGPAFEIEQSGANSKASTRPNPPGNMAGIPCLALPCGYTKDNLPIGMQIMGRWWDEETVLHMGYAYEQATLWHRRHPALAV
ncbi:MAG: aspartyl/glutamyl-tRNA amidotransferase subunit A [Chloroflexi bacterium]|nr:aspartyl/glutamyl-tRNA amidotransferase subunit A [Chloroflexota bacterium]